MHATRTQLSNACTLLTLARLVLHAWHASATAIFLCPFVIQYDSNTDIISLKKLSIRIEWWIETEGEAHWNRCCLALQYYHKIHKFVQKILYKTILNK